MLEASYSPNCNNVLVDKGIVKRRTGYLAMTTDTHAGGSIAGTVLGVIEFTDDSGSRHIVLVTTTKQYTYSHTDSHWDDVTGGTTWDGTEDNYLDWAVGQDGGDRYLYITNGKNRPLQWTGSGAFADLSGHANITGNNLTTVRSVVGYAGRLFLANITDSNADYPQTIAWSAAGDFDNWTGVGSGTLHIPDLQGEILRIEPVGSVLAIFSENTIGLLNYVGGEVLFSPVIHIQDSRLISGRTVVSVGPYLLYMSQENIYLYDGSRVVQPVGDAIHLSYRVDLSAENSPKGFAFHDAAKRRVYWAVPTGADANEVFMLEYDVWDLSKLTWTKLELTNRPTCFGFYKQPDDLTWESGSIAGITYEEMMGTWEDTTNSQDFPILVHGSGSTVYQHPGISDSDNATSYTALWESKDFTIPQEYRSMEGRWLEIELELKGTTVGVYYSTDQGASWTLNEMLTLSQSWTRYHSYVDKVSETFRVKLASTGGNFELRWIRVWAVPGSPR